MADSPETRLAKLGIELPLAPAAVGFYVPAAQFGNLVMTSGQLPFVGKQIAFEGRVGDQLHEEDGRNAARICALNALAQIRALVGSLDRIVRIVRVEGYVLSASGYQGQPHVINGASELLVQVFGEAGRHTRIAVGVHEMPMNAAVQLAVWAEVAAESRLHT
jgi:enamine deaminase RidA (YjgF/YER057c/UK114 family)